MIRSAENIPHGVSPFLITFSMTNTAHGVVGYGIESGEWEFDGKAYDRRILLWDSNSPDQFDAERCLYFDYATFDYCIPHYGIRVSDGDLTSTAGIIDIVTDLSILNRCPYPLIPQGEKGDLNLDGNVTAADAVLLCKHLTTQEIMNAGQMQRADLSGDKAVNAADLTLLKRLLLT